MYTGTSMPLATTETSDDDILLRVSTPSVMTTTALRCGSAAAPDGVIPAAGMQSASDMLVAFDPELRDAKVNLTKTFDGRFVKKAAGM